MRTGRAITSCLRAFVPRQVLSQMDEQLETCGYRTHEFGDSVSIELTGT